MVNEMADLKCVARLKLHDGKLDEFRGLAESCMDIMREKDAGTLEYEIYVDEGETECILIERYRDSSAVVEHNANLGDKLGEMLGTGSITADILGNPSDEIKAMIDGSPIRIFAPLLSLQDRSVTASGKGEETR